MDLILLCIFLSQRLSFSKAVASHKSRGSVAAVAVLPKITTCSHKSCKHAATGDHKDAGIDIDIESELASDGECSCSDDDTGTGSIHTWQSSIISFICLVYTLFWKSVKLNWGRTVALEQTLGEIQNQIMWLDEFTCLLRRGVENLRCGCYSDKDWLSGWTCWDTISFYNVRQLLCQLTIPAPHLYRHEMTCRWKCQRLWEKRCGWWGDVPRFWCSFARVYVKYFVWGTSDCVQTLIILMRD